jgi:hypothetical protein
MKTLRRIVTEAGQQQKGGPRTIEELMQQPWLIEDSSPQLRSRLDSQHAELQLLLVVLRPLQLMHAVTRLHWQSAEQRMASVERPRWLVERRRMGAVQTSLLFV